MEDAGGQDEVGRRVQDLDVDGTEGRGRPRMRCGDRVEGEGL